MTAEERAETEARANGAFEVELAKSGVTLTIPPDRSILDVLLSPARPTIATNS